MIQLKVSGITSGTDAEAALRAGATMLACVFHPSSPRYVTLDQAWDVRSRVPPEVPLVGIFVNAPAPLVERVRSHCGLSAVQLFGAESRAHVDALDGAFKAVSVHNAEEVDEAVGTYLHRWKRQPPALVLHLAAPVADHWDLATKATSDGDVLLASGALAPATLAAALEAAHPWGIDVWEQVESKPGVIDAARLGDLADAWRAAATPNESFRSSR